MKTLKVERVEVWEASIKDEPGGLARVLASLRDAGADLDVIICRRTPHKPGGGVVYVAPLRGDEQVSAAAMLGFNVTTSVQSVRVEGDNEAGIASLITQQLAEAGINLRGLTAAVTGERFILYIGLDNADDAAKAVRILHQP